MRSSWIAALLTAFSLARGAVPAATVGKKSPSSAVKSKKKTVASTSRKKHSAPHRLVKAAGYGRLAFTPIRKFFTASIAPPITPLARETAAVRILDRMSASGGHLEQASALSPFYASLLGGETTHEPVHILQFGDSHTASDDWVDSMRQVMQLRYGNGGPGFAMAGRPYRGYRRFDIRGDSSEGWRTDGTVNHPGDGRLGLAGVGITANSSGQTVHMTDTGTDQLELLYLKQPGGGSFVIETDGGSGEVVSTDGELATGFYRTQPTPGQQHSYTVRTLSSAPVRLYGWSAENRSGVTWETMGINGAQASIMLGWDRALWTQQIQMRNPSLVVLAYGTNEANNPLFEAETFRRSMRELIERVQRAVPTASILLVGPPDCGKLRPLAHLDEVIEVERTVARENGVAFWDWRDHMGGPRSTVMWVQAGLGQPDSVHLTAPGYRLLGQTLASELLLELARGLKASTGQLQESFTQ